MAWTWLHTYIVQIELLILLFPGLTQECLTFPSRSKFISRGISVCVYTSSYHCLVRVSISIHPTHTVVNHCENAQEHASHNNNNECTGVQNTHRYCNMHAHSMAHCMHVQYHEYWNYMYIYPAPEQDSWYYWTTYPAPKQACSDLIKRWGRAPGYVTI